MGAAVMALHLSGFLPMHLPARLIHLRKAANLTQQTLAKVLHVSLDRIQRQHQARRLAGAPT